MLITSSMEKSYIGSKRHDDPDDCFTLKEWALKAKPSRESTSSSRRFSASNVKSFRENEKSFRSSITISSTVSSPGYTIGGGIDPSTYSFTTALKALQAKTVYTWEYISPDHHGLTLNSKWNDAEKYICNPLSGQVPLECLSSKALSSSRITMSAPLIYHPISQLHHHPNNSPITQHHNQVQEGKRSITRDVGTQSTVADLSSSRPTPTSTGQSCDHQANITATKKPKSKPMVEVKETIEKFQKYRKRNEGRERNKAKMMMTTMMLCGHGGKRGCLSFRNFIWSHKARKNNSNNNNNNLTSPTCFYHVNACFEQ